MKINLARSGITTMALTGVVLLVASATNAVAQQNATPMEDSEKGKQLVWWVVGSGGVLGSESAEGRSLSATVGQGAIEELGSASNGLDQPLGLTASIGYWLPESGNQTSLAPSESDAVNNGAFVLTNHPNPFNNLTTINYQLPDVGYARLRISDMNGRQVRLLVDGEQAAGSHMIAWDARDDAGGLLPSGAYIYTLELQANGTTSTNEPGATTRGMMYLVK